MNVLVKGAILTFALVMTAGCSSKHADHKAGAPVTKPKTCAQSSADEIVASSEGLYTDVDRDLAVSVSAEPGRIDLSGDQKPRLYVHIPAVLGTYFPKGNLNQEFATVLDQSDCKTNFGTASAKLDSGETVELTLVRSENQLTMTLRQTEPEAKILAENVTLEKVTATSEIRELNKRLVAPVLAQEDRNKLDLEMVPTASDAGLRQPLYVAAANRSVYQGQLTNVLALIQYLNEPARSKIHCALPVTKVAGRQAAQTVMLNELLAHGNTFGDCAKDQTKRFDKRSRFLMLFANSETLERLRSLKLASAIGIDRRLLAQDLPKNQNLRAEGFDLNAYFNENNVYAVLKQNPAQAADFILDGLRNLAPAAFQAVLQQKLIEPNGVAALVQRAEARRVGPKEISSAPTWLAGFRLRQSVQRYDVNLLELKKQLQVP